MKARFPLVRMSIGSAIAGLAVFAIAGAAGGTLASWKATATIDAGSITSGTIAVEVNGFEGLSTEYSASHRIHTAIVTLRNAGDIASDYAVSFLNDDEIDELGNSIAFDIWTKPAASSCAGMTPLTDVASGNLRTKPMWTPGRLGPGESERYCFRTSIIDPLQPFSSQSVDAQYLKVAAVAGNWRAEYTSGPVDQRIEEQP